MTTSSYLTVNHSTNATAEASFTNAPGTGFMQSIETPSLNCDPSCYGDFPTLGEPLPLPLPSAPWEASAPAALPCVHDTAVAEQVLCL